METDYTLIYDKSASPEEPASNENGHVNGHASREAEPAYVVFEHVKKVYHVGEVDIEALSDASFAVAKGELAVVVGESGAGKTTLLNILGGMDTLTSGRVTLDGREISSFSRRQLTDYRRYDIGFVFQFYNLVQNLTALENVSLATQICNDPLDPAETLKAVGLGDRMNNFPGQLSGGEQQRVAIARALAKNPKLLLCDEPTGALDYNTGKQILQLLQDQARRSGTTVIIITHNQAITPMADRVISVRSGRVTDVKVNRNPLPISEIEW
ncbi:MAG: ABC transporter ATP-binding protein [Mogibacterium sp.]|nr:ABC transporter ATP-binding protein [Mogibacterium sp.]